MIEGNCSACHCGGVTLVKDLLAQHAWLMLPIWGLVYLSDYYLTIYCARLFQGPLKEHIRFEGSFELTPAFQKDVDALRLLSPRFLLRLLLAFPLVFLVWWLASEFLGMPQFFYFLMGGLLLREVAVHLRHARNIALAHLVRTAGSIQGRIEYSRWLSLRLSAIELSSFGVIFLALSVAMGSWFFLGGAFASLLTGYQHWRYARKQAAPKLA